MNRNEKLLYIALENLLHRLQHPHSIHREASTTSLTFMTRELEDVMGRASAALDGRTPEEAAYHALTLRREELDEKVREASEKATAAEAELMARKVGA